MPASVLVVEDERATRTALALILQSAGHATAEAPDGARAAAYLRTHPPPKVILLDMMMPVMDGWQFLAERHREPALSAVPVVVITAAVGLDGPAVRALGAEDVLHKPVPPEELLAAVARYC